MKANLHLHSLYSDGYPWPEQIVSRACGVGLEIISLTDHDCMNGVEEFLAACRKSGISGIPGVEIDCADSSHEFWSEILGYFPSGRFDRTREFTVELMKKRFSLMKKLLRQGREYYQNQNLDLHHMMINKTGSDQGDPERFCFSKPDLLYLLRKEKILADDIPYTEYKKLFKKDQVFDVGQSEKPPTPQEVIDVILSDGGIPVLAHPVYIYEMREHNMDALQPKLLALFRHFKSCGLKGIELNYYYDNTSLYNNRIKEIALQSGFDFFTVGSDCHGKGHEHDTMEKYMPEFEGF